MQLAGMIIWLRHVRKPPRVTHAMCLRRAVPCADGVGDGYRSAESVASRDRNPSRRVRKMQAPGCAAVLDVGRLVNSHAEWPASRRWLAAIMASPGAPHAVGHQGICTR